MNDKYIVIIHNIRYIDWIDGFYKPLMIQSCRCVRPGGIVAIYIGDTSAGAIDSFMRETVVKITTLQYLYMVGFSGIKSKKLRGIFVYRKPDCNQLH
jgi:hypothetical protein